MAAPVKTTLPGIASGQVARPGASACDESIKTLDATVSNVLTVANDARSNLAPVLSDRECLQIAKRKTGHDMPSHS